MSGAYICTERECDCVIEVDHITDDVLDHIERQCPKCGGEMWLAVDKR